MKWQLSVTGQMPLISVVSRHSTLLCSTRWCPACRVWKPFSASRRYFLLHLSWCVRRAKRKTSWTKPSVLRLPTISSSPSIPARFSLPWKRTSTTSRLWQRWLRVGISRTSWISQCRFQIVSLSMTGRMCTVDLYTGNWSWAVRIAIWLKFFLLRKKRQTSASPSSSRTITWTGLTLRMLLTGRC